MTTFEERQQQAQATAQAVATRARETLSSVSSSVDKDRLVDLGKKAGKDRRFITAASVALVSALFFLFNRRVTEHRYPVPPKGVVLVTGTGSGIGHNITSVLAENGYQVFASVHRSESVKELEKEEIKNVHPIKLDVTHPHDIDAAYDTIIRYLKESGLQFSGLVNNAGMMDRNPLELHDIDAVRHLFETNAFGPLRVTQRFLPLIREHKGRVVFTSSVAGRLTQPKEGAYSATKHAIEAFGNALRQELMTLDVSVSLVEPGFVDTQMMDKIKECEAKANSTAGGKVYPHLYVPQQAETYDKGISKAGSPMQPAKAVLHALTSPYPRTRYEVTNIMSIPTWLVVKIKAWLPDRVFDKIVVP